MKKFKVVPFEECTKKQQNCRVVAFISVISIVTVAIVISAINSFYGWIEMAAASSALVEAEEKAYLAKRDAMLMEQIEKEAAEKAESETIEADPLDGYEPSQQILALINMPSLRETFGPEFPEDEIEQELKKFDELLEESIMEMVKKIAISHRISVEDVIIMAKTLYGETNGVKSTCERSMVAWTIKNRVDSPLFPNSITEVCTAPQQFTGYSANHPVTMENLLLIDDVLTRSEREEAGETNVGRTLPSDIFYFRADSNPAAGEWHNKFFKYATDNKTRIYYDRDNPIANPYAD